MIREFFVGTVQHRQYIVMGNSMFKGAIFGVTHRDRIAQADPIKDQVHCMRSLPPEIGMSNWAPIKDLMAMIIGPNL